MGLEHAQTKAETTTTPDFLVKDTSCDMVRKELRENIQRESVKPRSCNCCLRATLCSTGLRPWTPFLDLLLSN